MDLNSHFFEPYLNRAKAYLAKKDNTNALADVNTFLDHFPKNQDALNLKAQIGK
jgi:regulator of sirC expression with transglutaminase-like and TPR domain